MASKVLRCLLFMIYSTIRKWHVKRQSKLSKTMLLTVADKLTATIKAINIVRFKGYCMGY